MSRILEGLSGTTNKGKIVDQHLLNEKFSNQFVTEIVDIALDATQIPLSIFTNLFHQKFEKYSILESTLEILQQFYIQMESEPDEMYCFPGDLSTYMLRCKRCGQHVTLHASIETLYSMHPLQSCITGHRELMLMPLVFTSYENYLGSTFPRFGLSQNMNFL